MNGAIGIDIKKLVIQAIALAAIILDFHHLAFAKQDIFRGGLGDRRIAACFVNAIRIAASCAEPDDDEDFSEHALVRKKHKLAPQRRKMGVENFMIFLVYFDMYGARTDDFEIIGAGLERFKFHVRSGGSGSCDRCH